MNDDPVIQVWNLAPGSTFMPGEQIWKVFPIRVLEADPLECRPDDYPPYPPREPVEVER